MHIRIYVPGAPLYRDDPETGESVFCGRSTASIRNLFKKREELPVFLQDQQAGRAVHIEKLEIGEEPYLDDPCCDISLEIMTRGQQFYHLLQ